MNKYTITVNESDNGTLSVASVRRTVAINQYRSDNKAMPRDTFGFADAKDPKTLTRRAASKAR